MIEIKFNNLTMGTNLIIDGHQIKEITWVAIEHEVGHLPKPTVETVMLHPMPIGLDVEEWTEITHHKGYQCKPTEVPAHDNAK